jgi:ferredoxin
VHLQTLNAFIHTLRFEADDTISVDLRPVGDVWAARSSCCTSRVRAPAPPSSMNCRRSRCRCTCTSMLDAFEKICAELGHENAHLERFAAVAHEAAEDARKTFTVELVRSKQSFTVTPEKSILDTLLDAGILVDHSCCEGVCGSCETRVLSGEPDHRDSILSAKERAGNKVMMICVSGCKSASLALDL